MPAYDYRCDPCDAVFEIVRPSSDRSEVACPACGGESKRVYSPVGVVFKGSGFHSTDYRTEPASPAPASSEEGKGCPAKKPTCEGCPASQETSGAQDT